MQKLNGDISRTERITFRMSIWIPFERKSLNINVIKKRIYVIRISDTKNGIIIEKLLFFFSSCLFPFFILDNGIEQFAS